MTPRLLAFEGPDGAGKSTVAAAVAERLRAAGADCMLLSFPGGEDGTVGRLVYDLHHDPKRFAVNDLTPLALQTLHVAAHVDAIESKIRPALLRGTTVLLDRFWWSTWVYGRASGVSDQSLRLLLAFEQRVWDEVPPADVVLLQRSATCSTLQSLYEQLASEHAPRTHVIPNDGPVEMAIASVCALFPSRRLRGGKNAARAVTRGVAHQQLEIPGAIAEKTSVKAHANGRRGHVFRSLAPAKTSVVFDTYWKFACERQQIFHRRVRGDDAPWTDDPILLKHKFTNAYRASDRVSQYLIQHVIYDHCAETFRDEFFRVLLFKLFNKVETWEFLVSEFGQPSVDSFSLAAYDRALQKALDQRRTIYSAAYIMPSGRSVFGFARKHQTHLRLLDEMLKQRLPERIEESASLQGAFMLLREVPTFGDFLAYQYLIDLNYGRFLRFSEMEFIVPGPGARDGIRKCFPDLGGLSEADIIKMVTDRQDLEFERLGLRFQSLWGRPLQLIDCQNLFCEVDKYARVRHPEVQGVSGRTRIKQMFTPKQGSLRVSYPPKWGINEKIELPLTGRESRSHNSALARE